MMIDIDDIMVKIKKFLAPYMPKGSELNINITLTIPKKKKKVVKK